MQMMLCVSMTTGTKVRRWHDNGRHVLKLMTTRLLSGASTGLGRHPEESPKDVIYIWRTRGLLRRYVHERIWTKSY